MALPLPANDLSSRPVVNANAEILSPLDPPCAEREREEVQTSQSWN